MSLDISATTACISLFTRSWACFGYFIRLLDTTNMSESAVPSTAHVVRCGFHSLTIETANAYVSGMKEVSRAPQAHGCF